MLVAAVVGPANAEAPDEVDQTLLVPTTLDSSFAPFVCKAKQTGPVCTGERHLVEGWAPVDFPCGVPVYGARTEDRWQTRYYNAQYLNYDRWFRSHDVDYLSTEPSGPATATISANVRFREPFAVPGDDSTITVITSGLLYDIRSSKGEAIFRAVGTLVEPPDAAPTFTGQVTIDGTTTTYVDALFDTFFTDDAFVGWVCRAITGG
ncbi:hypothetical protein [Nocardioides bigeumensis]|uniref:hypothetical protein n=1 Tax=Nocardioides bigeumensis TaxID=433657 RepID=UPI0031D7F328